FSPSKVHARGIIAITSSLIEYLLAKLLSFQGFIVLFGVGSLRFKYKTIWEKEKKKKACSRRPNWFSSTLEE
ncbi:hypothetical protein LOB66_09590, partial [Lactobacillus delbrueckii subsp. lactis]|uniref:hypothetical protein n=1 Tax=Lactobacillus delbrueckii TaxID=1584 RepID=UPI001E42C6FB